LQNRRVLSAFAAHGHHSGFVDAAQKRADDDLLFVLFDVGELAESCSVRV
jgi:hypothetical protein